MKNAAILMQSVVISGFAAFTLIKAVTTPDINISQKDIIRSMMAMKSSDRNNSMTLKQCVVGAYNATTDQNINAKEAAVVMIAPSAVSAPTINNSFFVVASKDADGVSNAGAEKGAKTDTISEQEEKISGWNALFTNVFAEEDHKQETTQKADIYETDISTAFQIADLDEGLDLDRISALPSEGTVDRQCYNTLYKTTSDNQQLELVLSSASVTLTEPTGFNPYDYIVSSSSWDGLLPRISVSGNVDPTENGSYIEEYTVSDTIGNKITASIQVVVNLPDNGEAVLLEQQIKAMRALSSYAEQRVGKSIDVDHAFNDQCWDLWAEYCITNGMDFDYHTLPYGYAYGVSLKYYTSGASRYFQAVGKDEIKPGDWLFWGYGSEYPLSHVALLLQDNHDGTGVCLTQTEGYGTTISTLSLNGLMDVNMRPIGQYAWFRQ